MKKVQSIVDHDQNSKLAVEPEIGRKQLISMKSFKVGPEIFVGIKQGSFKAKYSIGEVLGEGAYGKVCKVIHRQTNIVRAMKSIRKVNIDKEEEERLFSEMNILKNLDHPNILKLFELY